MSFWYGVKRMRSDPAFSAASATAARIVPETRPAMGATPTALSPLRSFCTPTWSIGRAGFSGAGPSSSGRFRYYVSRTSRNFSTPQSLIRNFSRAFERRRR